MTKLNDLSSMLALIAYLNDEPGADKVEDLLDQAQQNHVQVYVTAVNIYEMFYDCLKRDAATARQLVDEIYMARYSFTGSGDVRSRLGNLNALFFCPCRLG